MVDSVKCKMQRESNIELLRIFAMIMIIAHHYCIHGIFDYWHSNATLTCYINSVIASIISIGGKIGADIFVLITGYFLISSGYKLSKFFKIFLITFVYSLLILLITYMCGEYYVALSFLKKSLLPISTSSYWFISSYLMLYLFIPFINRFVLTAKKTMLNMLMFLLTLVLFTPLFLLLADLSLL